MLICAGIGLPLLYFGLISFATPRLISVDAQNYIGASGRVIWSLGLIPASIAVARRLSWNDINCAIAIAYLWLYFIMLVIWLLLLLDVV